MGKGAGKPFALALIAVAVMLAVPATAVSVDSESPQGSMLPEMKDYVYKVTYGRIGSTDTWGITGTYINGSSSPATSVSVGFDGSWGFKDGLGPFNCFYAAVNTNSSSDPGRMHTDIGTVAFILDPYDLSNVLGKTKGYTMEDYNIMLIIPVVYWYSDGVGNLYVSNSKTNPLLSEDVSSRMVSYAHTMNDGTADVEFPYVAISVYEPFYYDRNGPQKQLRSMTGKLPDCNGTLDQYRVIIPDVDDTYGEYALWNYYQYTMFKIMCQTVMGSKNAQATMGLGNTYTSQRSVAGLANSDGPYYNVDKSYSKLFVENPWGSVNEYIGNAYLLNGVLYAGNGLGTPAAGTATGTDWLGGRYSIPPVSGHKPITNEVRTSEAWDLVTSRGEGDYAGTTGDEYWSVNRGSPNVIVVGGGYDNTNLAGLSMWSSDNKTNGHYASWGTRLAYVMTDKAVGMGVTYETDSGEVAGEVPVDGTKHLMGQPFTVKGNTGGLEVEDLNKVFIGWEYGGVVYTPGDKITMPASDITLKSRWAYPIITLKFDKGEGGGGPMADQIFGFDSPTKIRPNEYSFPDHSFLKWVGKGSDGKDYEFSDGQTVEISSLSPVGSLTISLTAQWLGNYMLSYEVGAGSLPAPDPVITMATDNVILAGYDGIREGYDFGGWSYGGSIYKPGQEFTMPFSTVVMTAHWVKEKVPAPEEDEDDIIDILNHNRVPSGQTRSSTLNIAVITAAVALCVASCLVLAVWRRSRSLAPARISLYQSRESHQRV